MNPSLFEREHMYQTTVALARTMLSKGLLTADEFVIFDTKMREKYKPSLGGLYPVNPSVPLDNKAFPSDI